ncbi:MAG: polysaccharide deacetylase [Rhizobacter sp.]|nr:polysaccharide deacetylase [Rhizobacter sp.]
MKLPYHHRYDFSPIVERPVYDWPGGKRVAVFLCNNIEFFAFSAGLGTDSADGAAKQNQRNWGWKDYGNRVGLWRYLDLLDEFGIPGAHNVNSAVFEHCPGIAERLVARGDEIIGHGRSNAERQDVLWEEDEARLIGECTQVLTRMTGRQPKGWLGPYLAETGVTLDLLVEAGYEYVMEWPADDQPFWMKTRSGPILSVPYPIELNDSPSLVFRKHTARDFADMLVDQFDEMLEQSQKYPLVFSIALHPFIIGQPYRLRAFRRALDHIFKKRDEFWLATPGAIAAHVATLPAGVVPGSPQST